MPPQASASASPTFCTHWPMAPRAIWRRAMTGDLWVLAWARSLAPVGASSAAMRSRLYSNASRSMSRAGVSISSSRMPGWAGGACSMVQFPGCGGMLAGCVLSGKRTGRVSGTVRASTARAATATPTSARVAISVPA